MQKTSEFLEDSSNLFDYWDYKAYLKDRLSKSNTFHSAPRSALANALGIQLSYLSRVLNGNADLSLEQGLEASIYLKHTLQEREFFLNLVQYGRAGTSSLKVHFRKELEKQKISRLSLRNRVSLSQPLTLEDQAVYYSAWYFSALHMLLTIPKFQKISHPVGTKLREMSNFLNLPIEIVEKVIQFLIKTGIVKIINDEYKVMIPFIHLDSHSPFEFKHHINWRLKSIQQLENQVEGSLCYSSVVSISHQDVDQAKLIFLEAIEKMRSLVINSKEETLMVYCLDMLPFSFPERGGIGDDFWQASANNNSDP